MLRIVPIVMILCAGCVTGGGDWAHFDDGSLSQWLDHNAAPQFAETLAAHPRFRAETIRVAVMRGDAVELRSDALSASMRDALHARLLQVPGLSLTVHDGPTACDTSLDGYYLGFELTRLSGTAARAQLRLYDIVERQWVSGFAAHWQGRLERAALALATRAAVAETARGARELPYDASQSDLLAAQLARELACELRRSGNDELVVTPAAHRGATLVAGNLAASNAIRVASDGQLSLDTRVHEVDGGLYQVWALLIPVGDAAAEQSFAVRAYASAPLLRRPVAAQTAVVESKPVPTQAPANRTRGQRLAPRRERSLIGAATVVGPMRGRDCDARSPAADAPRHANRTRIGADECFAIEFDADPQARIFIIGRETDGSFVQVYPSDCRPGGMTTGTRTRHRFPALGAIRWDGRGGEEDFVIVAARTAHATGRIEALTRALPQPCDAREVRAPGREWSERLRVLVDDLGDDAAVTHVRVRHVTETRKRRAHL